MKKNKLFLGIMISTGLFVSTQVSALNYNVLSTKDYVESYSSFLVTALSYHGINQTDYELIMNDKTEKTYILQKLNTNINRFVYNNYLNYAVNDDLLVTLSAFGLYLKLNKDQYDSKLQEVYKASDLYFNDVNLAGIIKYRILPYETAYTPRVVLGMNFGLIKYANGSITSNLFDELAISAEFTKKIKDFNVTYTLEAKPYTPKDSKVDGLSEINIDQTLEVVYQDFNLSLSKVYGKIEYNTDTKLQESPSVTRTLSLKWNVLSENFALTPHFSVDYVDYKLVKYANETLMFSNDSNNAQKFSYIYGLNIEYTPENTRGIWRFQTAIKNSEGDTNSYQAILSYVVRLN